VTISPVQEILDTRHRAAVETASLAMAWVIGAPRIRPMRLFRIAKPFDDPDYVFELKHDVFRALA
jgi:hypothetical protein